jgi:uncharacterized protein
VQRQCPICKTTFTEAQPEPYHPFCSPRCKRVDLGNWLSGAYTLPRALLPEDIEGLSEEEQAELLMRMSNDKGIIA